MQNVLGREGRDRPFTGAFSNSEERTYTTGKNKRPVLVEGIPAALDRVALGSGQTVSFHHHLRNGDRVLEPVMAEIAARGIHDLTLAASAVFPAHACLTRLIAEDVVTHIETAYISGPVAAAVSAGALKGDIRMLTHGGRARAILEGDTTIQAAFIAAPAVDRDGRISGVRGSAACGSLGYAVADAWRADVVVAVTDHVTDGIIDDPDIDAGCVDVIALVDSIGDTSGIVSGTTQLTRDPVGLKIAASAAAVIEKSGYFENGFSFQTGAGGISLATAAALRERMAACGITGSFGSGGITAAFTRMLREGFFETLYDVQAFDLDAIASSASDRRHRRISASEYANPNQAGHVAGKLDAVVLGASEIDLDFNVNVTTGSNGVLLGGSGGHADTAAGAKVSIIVSKLVNARVACLCDRVTTVTTPGETVDVLVTDRGIAVNPRRTDLIARLSGQPELELVDIKMLYERALNLTGMPAGIPRGSREIGVSVYRDGTVIDVLHATPAAI